MVLAGSPLADDPVYHIVETPDRRSEASVPGGREPRRDEETQAREPAVVEVLDLGAEAGDLLDAWCDVGVEQRAGHDPQCQRGECVVQVDGLAGAPRLDRLLRVAGHRPPVVGHTLPMERRRRQPTVA
jgi:hypothetical protein